MNGRLSGPRNVPGALKVVWSGNDVNYSLLTINLKVSSIAVKVTCVTKNKEPRENKVIQNNF